MNKLVSVIVPVFNGGKYLEDFLKSLEEQTYRPLQIIIGDDCSTDNSKDICLAWKKESEKENFQIVFMNHKENVGLSQNVSRLAQHVKGDYIFLADQDDVWLKGKIECQVQYLEKNSNCAVCLCDRAVTNEKLDIIEESNYAYCGYAIHSMDFKEVIKHKSAYAANCMAIRNNGNVNEIFNIPPNVVKHDTFVVMMAAHYGTVDFLYEVLELYRIHRNNLSANFQALFAKNRLQCFMNYLKKGRRAIQSAEYDGDAIRAEMKSRFDINIDDYPNCFQNRVKVTRFIWAYERTKKDYNKGLIGKWR